jgi:hypothetical protein
MRILGLLLALGPCLFFVEEPDPLFLESVLPEETLLYLAIPNSSEISATEY